MGTAWLLLEGAHQGPFKVFLVTGVAIGDIPHSRVAADTKALKFTSRYCSQSLHTPSR